MVVRKADKGKAGKVSDITIRHGDPVNDPAGVNTLGKKTLGGVYSQEQAIREFNRNPASFGVNAKTPLSTWTLCRIHLGPLVVALADFCGEFTAEQALAEFNRIPHVFERGEGFDAATRLGLVA